MPRARFETATTVRFSNSKCFLKALENFNPSAKFKLNLSQGTAHHYANKIRTFMLNRKTVTDGDVQEHIAPTQRTFATVILNLYPTF
jgi:hypothetical protein